MSQEFGIQAISSAHLAANLTLALIMVHARATRRAYPGFNEWVASQIILTAGLVLVSLRAQLPSWIALLMGNSLLVLSQVFVYIGFTRFFDLQRLRRWPVYGLFATFTGCFSWLLLAESPAPLRSLVFSVFIAAMLVCIFAALALQQKLRKDPLVRLLLAAVFIFMGFFLARALVLSLPKENLSFWDAQLLLASFYVGIIYSTLLVFGFLQLVQARTEDELQIAQANAEALANTDRLTGAWNRRRFEHEAEREMARATRYKQSLSLIAFDIDNFKQINDRHGHQAGDEVLTEICRIVSRRIRSADALVRWGGDEFLIMTPMTNSVDAAALAEALRADVASHKFGPVDKVTLSLGVAEYHSSESQDAWLARADRGTYAAKVQGRDQVVVDQPNQG